MMISILANELYFVNGDSVVGGERSLISVFTIDLINHHLQKNADFVNDHCKLYCFDTNEAVLRKLSK